MSARERQVTHPHVLMPGLRLPLLDRTTAGALLAAQLDAYASPDTLVLGIPRGGVPVAAAVAAALGAELDVVVTRKLGAPFQPELAIGAVAADGTRVLDRESLALAGVPQDYLDAVTRRERAEAQRRELRFRGGRPPPWVRGRAVIIVDDGLATGATVLAAVDAVRRQSPKRLVVAAPVGSREACELLAAHADEVVVLAEPEPFIAVGLHYRTFDQVEDDEVLRLLEGRA